MKTLLFVLAASALFFYFGFVVGEEMTKIRMLRKVEVNAASYLKQKLLEGRK